MSDPLLDRLPRAYRIGLRLRALGADDDLIAECLDIDPRSVDALLDIGTRKLVNAERDARFEGIEGGAGPNGLP